MYHPCKRTLYDNCSLFPIFLKQLHVTKIKLIICGRHPADFFPIPASIVSQLLLQQNISIYTVPSKCQELKSLMNKLGMLMVFKNYLMPQSHFFFSRKYMGYWRMQLNVLALRTETGFS